MVLKNPRGEGSVELPGDFTHTPGGENWKGQRPTVLGRGHGDPGKERGGMEMKVVSLLVENYSGDTATWLGESSSPQLGSSN